MLTLTGKDKKYRKYRTY